MSAVLAPNPSGVPVYLSGLLRWLLWCIERRVNRKTGETEKTKPPISYHTGKKCDATDPANWTDFLKVVAALERSRAWGGFGIALGEVPEHSEILIGLDVDNCLDDDDAIAEWAMPFLIVMASYVEYSPGGVGLKCLARIRFADLAAARKLLDIPEGARDQARTRTFGERTSGVHAPGVQLFVANRYFTITGRHWHASPEDVTLLSLGQLAELGVLFGRKERAATPRLAAHDTGNDNESEPELCALEEKLGVAFVRNPNLKERWEGGKQGLHDTSRSGRDMSVLAMLVIAGFTKGETRAALRLFAHGKLVEEEQHPKRGAYYFEQMWARTKAGPRIDPNDDLGRAPREAEALAECGRGTPADDTSIDVLTEISLLGPGRTLQQLVRIFNRKYAVANEGGKAVVIWAIRDPLLRRDRHERASFADFIRFFQNQTLSLVVDRNGKTKTVTASYAEWWLDHPLRRQYLGGVVFDPAGRAQPDTLNLWRGWAVAPKPGNWSLMRNHIRRIICGGRADIYAYVIRWLAHMVQKPHLPAETAIVLHGLKGTGKGMLGKWLLRLCGQHGLHIVNAGHLTGRFSGHLQDTVFVFADEAFFAADRAHESTLKAIITENSLLIEAKYRTPVMAPNMLHLLMASNSTWVIPATHDERRYLMLDVASDRKGDATYFRKLDRQMDQGGLAAMLHYLLNLKLGDFHPRAVPATAELDEQKIHSLDSLHRWWMAVLDRGFVWRSRYGHQDFLTWHEFVSTELLNQSYRQWCADNRVFYPEHREALSTFLGKFYPATRPRGEHPIYEAESIDHKAPEPVMKQQRPRGFKIGDPVVKQHRPRGFVVGNLDTARRKFRDTLGFPPGTFAWDEEQ